MFRQLPDARTLETLAGVRRVLALGEGRYRIELDDGADPREAIVKAAVEGGWGLLELRAEAQTLEEIFVETDLARRRAGGGRMSNILNIARTELKRIFLSPLAWAVLAVVQFIMGFVFINLLVDYANNAGMQPDDTIGVSDYVAGSLYGFATILLLLVMPLMTMRLFAEERKGNTLVLLTSAPVSITEIVLGKFLGLLGFVLAIVVLMAAMPLSLHWSTNLDWGRVAAGLLGPVPDDDDLRRRRTVLCPR